MKNTVKKLLVVSLLATTALSAAETFDIMIPKNNIANVWVGSAALSGVEGICIMNVLYFTGYRSRALSYNIKTGRPFFCKKDSANILVYTDKKHVH